MRRRNLIGAGETPYPLPRLEPVGPAGDTECDGGDYRETLERCLGPPPAGIHLVTEPNRKLLLVVVACTDPV